MALEFNSGGNERITLFVDVILPLPLPKLYTYRVPFDWNDHIQQGSRVIVQFGSKKILTAIVAAIHEDPPALYEAKYILEILDEHPSVNHTQLKLFEWMADYYLCNIGDVLTAALPAGLKLSSESHVQLNPELDFNDFDLTDKELSLVSALHHRDSMKYEEIAKLTGVENPYNLVKSLVKKGLVILFEQVKEKYKPKREKKIRLTPHYLEETHLEAVVNELDKKPKQQQLIMQYLTRVPIINYPHLNEKGISKSSLLASEDSSPSSLKTLIKNGVLEEFEVIIPRFEMSDDDEFPEIQLSPDQTAARDQVLTHFNDKNAVLLHGVTGSGKTEIFIDLIQKALQGGSQVLYLLPEIALTTQIVTRLKKVFGTSMAVYHSRFSDNERVEVWQGLIEGKFNFVVGVRSSVFLPFDNLGLIIVDEEHETSYKQYDPAPRYQARDTALMLGNIHQAKVLLGSATPSIESYYQASNGQWGLVTLDKRFGEAQMPEIQLVDIRFLWKQKNPTGLSDKLLTEMEQTLSKQEQAIIFQNRRGYAPYMQCEDCGFIPTSPTCNVSLTLHRYANELRCHISGHRESIPHACPACGSPKLKAVGIGTEKIEDDLKVYFQEAVIQRMDLDTTRKKNSYQEIIEAFEQQKVDFLVGTQMVTKGLDFDHVSLVGIFNADRMIHYPDFRSIERAFQLMLQVSGRAGRKQKPGKVLIQTYNPYQNIFELIKNNDYVTFYQQEIAEREKFLYPPFSRLIRVTIKNETQELSFKTAQALQRRMINKIGQRRLLGPQAPVIDKIRDQYLYNLLIKLDRGKVDLKKAKAFIKESIDYVLSKKEFKTSRIVIDVDPV